MPVAKCPLKIEDNRMERQPLRDSLFACCAYHGDVHVYIGAQIPPHWHHEWEIFMLDEGEIEAAVSETQFSLQAGQGIFINADKLHRIRCLTEKPCRYHSMVFDPSIISGAVGSAFDIKYTRPFLENGPPALVLLPEEPWQKGVFDAFEEAFYACSDEPYAFEFTVRHALSQILIRIQQHTGEIVATRPPALREERLKQMIVWLDSHYMQPFTLRALAQAVHFSPRECERTFEQLLHTTPQKYLLRRRILAAMSLLAHQNLPVIEVAACCGFSNHSYFSKQFRAATGYTPREYRSKCQKV